MELESPGDDHERAAAGTLTVASTPGHVRVILSGEIDLAITASIRTTLKNFLVEGCDEVVINLAGVTFLDSSALGALVNAQRQARLFRAGLRLESPSPPVRRLLALTAMDRVFEISDEDSR